MIYAHSRIGDVQGSDDVYMYIHRSFHLSDDNVMSPISNVYARHLIMIQSLSSDETEMEQGTHSDPKRDRMLGEYWGEGVALNVA